MNPLRPSIMRPLFTLKLPENDIGMLEFGGIDHSQYEGDLKKIPLKKNSTTFAWKLEDTYLTSETAHGHISEHLGMDQSVVTTFGKSLCFAFSKDR